MEEYQENLRRHERRQQKYKEQVLAKQNSQWEREQQLQQHQRDHEGFRVPAPPEHRVPRSVFCHITSEFTAELYFLSSAIVVFTLLAPVFFLPIGHNFRGIELKFCMYS